MVVDIGVKKAEEETESAMNVGIMMNIVEALKEEYIMQLSRAYQKNQEDRIQLFSTYQTTHSDPMGMICSAIEEARKKDFIKNLSY